MNHVRSVSALVLTCALLVLSPGAAGAKVTETDGAEAGSNASSAYDHRSIPAAEAERDAALRAHWGLDRTEFGLQGTTGNTGNTDVGAARNDIGPAAPAEPETTPVTTGIDTGLVAGWTAAAVAVASSFIAAAMFLRRRREHLVRHA